MRARGHHSGRGACSSHRGNRQLRECFSRIAGSFTCDEVGSASPLPDRLGAAPLASDCSMPRSRPGNPGHGKQSLHPTLGVSTGRRPRGAVESSAPSAGQHARDARAPQPFSNDAEQPDGRHCGTLVVPAAATRGLCVRTSSANIWDSGLCDEDLRELPRGTGPARSRIGACDWSALHSRKRTGVISRKLTQIYVGNVGTGAMGKRRKYADNVAAETVL